MLERSGYLPSCFLFPSFPPACVCMLRMFVFFRIHDYLLCCVCHRSNSQSLLRPLVPHCVACYHRVSFLTFLHKASSIRYACMCACTYVHVCVSVCLFVPVGAYVYFEIAETAGTNIINRCVCTCSSSHLLEISFLTLLFTVHSCTLFPRTCLYS
jgi:hypothetical protein